MKTSDRDGMNLEVFKTEDEIKTGMIVRMRVMSLPEIKADESPFGDMVILGIKEGEVTIARPYVFAVGSETLARAATGTEIFSIPKERFCARFVKVLSTRGKMMTMNLD